VNATKLRRRATVVALLAVPALSSCASTNFGAQTDQYYTPTDGENAREGTVDVLHALIVSDTPGSGRLIAGLANGDAEEDTLTGVRGLEEDQGIQFALVEGETTIPAGGLLQLAEEGSAVISVSGDPESLAAGDYVRLAFTFGNGEEVPMNVPVLAPGEDYQDVEIPEAPTGADEPAEPADSEG
jgi:hypothetical protein